MQGGEVGLQVLMGDERNAAAGLLAGARGLVNLCISLEPATYLELFAAVGRKDLPATERLQTRINELVDNVALSTASICSA